MNFLFHVLSLEPWSLIFFWSSDSILKWVVFFSFMTNQPFIVYSFSHFEILSQKRGKSIETTFLDIIIFKERFINLKLTFPLTSCPSSFPLTVKWYEEKCFCSFKTFCQSWPSQNSTNKELLIFLFCFCTLIMLENMAGHYSCWKGKLCPKFHLWLVQL